MAKYDPLQRFLTNLKQEEWNATFDEVEALLGASLPSSAFQYREWWANETSPSSHVQANAWNGAGWMVDTVNMESAMVKFRKC